jgi:ATP-dependent helicase/nuclease subunit A
MKITFISASAGSGKTHRITEIIEDRLAGGNCRPGGLNRHHLHRQGCA